MKRMYNIFILFAAMFMSCSSHEESNYTKFHSYHWDVDSNPLIVSSSDFDENLVIKDNAGNKGGIIGVTSVLGINQQDTIIIYNTALKDNRNSIISDTLQYNWFTIINKKKSLQVILNKNHGSNNRVLVINIWSTHIEYTDDGEAACEPLTITQNPS